MGCCSSTKISKAEGSVKSEGKEPVVTAQKKFTKDEEQDKVDGETTVSKVAQIVQEAEPEETHDNTHDNSHDSHNNSHNSNDEYVEPAPVKFSILVTPPSNEQSTKDDVDTYNNDAESYSQSPENSISTDNDINNDTDNDMDNDIEHELSNQLVSYDDQTLLSNGQVTKTISERLTTFISGYTRSNFNDYNVRHEDFVDIIFQYYSSVDEMEKLATTTIIDKDTILESDIIHNYDILIIESNIKLSTNPWSFETNNGGKLILNCFSLILESNSSIDVSNQGYSGGSKGGFQGHSYKGISERSVDLPNYGGGSYSAGGGYGTKGHSNELTGKGGIPYGDRQLSTIYLGSGGGGAYETSGTNGGGAIIIKCDKNIIINKNAIINANGGDSRKETGHGSGGSIYLKSPIIVNNGSIFAIGGRDLYRKRNGGNGGFGRIRIDCNKDIFEKNVEMSEIEPLPYVEEI